uniref:Uncharacterized protein n=1 Tax=Oryza punctata TaxID=4537 RepID=A0A0E0LVU7_ORYPU
MALVANDMAEEACRKMNAQRGPSPGPDAILISRCEHVPMRDRRHGRSHKTFVKEKEEDKEGGPFQAVPVSLRSKETRAATRNPATPHSSLPSSASPPLEQPLEKPGDAGGKDGASGAFYLAPRPGGWGIDEKRAEGVSTAVSDATGVGCGGSSADGGGSGPLAARSGGSGTNRAASRMRRSVGGGARSVLAGRRRGTTRSDASEEGEVGEEAYRWGQPGRGKAVVGWHGVGGANQDGVRPARRGMRGRRHELLMVANRRGRCGQG